MKNIKNLSRRHFIQQTAAIAGASSLQTAMIKSALANNEGIKRLIIWYTPEGCAQQAFWPRNTGALSINPNATINNKNPRSRATSIRNYINDDDGPDCSTYCLQPLIDYTQDISLYSGFKGNDGPGASDAHAKAILGALTGGTPNEGSFDQIMGRELKGSAALPSIYSAHWAHHAHSKLSYLSPVRKIGGGTLGVPNWNPMEVYQDIFGDAGIPDSNGGTGEVPYGNRQSSLEIMKSMEARLEQVKCVGGEEARKKYEVLLASYQELHAQTSALLASEEASASGGGPNVQFDIPNGWDNLDNPPGKYWDKAENFEKLMDISINTAVAALALDKTRVSMLQFSGSGTDVGPAPKDHYKRLNLPGFEGGQAHDHQFGHGNESNKRRNQARIFRWYYSKFAQLIQKLKDTPDVDGSSLFDSTLIVTATEFSMHDHRYNDMPYMIAGGLGGTMKTGQYIDARNGNNFRHNAEFFHGVANALGVNLPRFGASSSPYTGMMK